VKSVVDQFVIQGLGIHAKMNVWSTTSVTNTNTCRQRVNDLQQPNLTASRKSFGVHDAPPYF